jgi:hypothetical protein
MADQAKYIMAVAKVAVAIGAWNEAAVLDRVHTSEHATEADLVELARIIEETTQGRADVDVLNAEYFFEVMLDHGIDLVRERAASVPWAPAPLDIDFDAFDDGESTPSSSRKLYSTQKDKGRPKGYAKWNPQKKTKVLMAQVQAILGEYEAELPLTARQIFYRLVGKYGYPKTEDAYESLTNHLVRARRSRMIRFESIRDDGASVIEGKFYTGEEDFYRYLHDEAKSYERDKLAGQESDIRVYVESAGMMP